MNFFSYLTIELKKLKHSKILLLLCIPVLMMWLPSIINSEKIFDTQQVPITPEHNFFIQGFMGMAWFMIPASLIICVVLLTQTEHRSPGYLKNALPASRYEKTVPCKICSFTASCRYTNAYDYCGLHPQRPPCFEHAGLFLSSGTLLCMERCVPAVCGGNSHGGCILDVRHLSEIPCFFRRSWACFHCPFCSHD